MYDRLFDNKEVTVEVESLDANEIKTGFEAKLNSSKISAFALMAATSSQVVHTTSDE